MAIQINKAETTGNGEDLTGVYIRVEPSLLKDGDKISFEISHYATKARYTGGYRTIRTNEVICVENTVSNDPYALYGLHQLLVASLTKVMETVDGEEVEVEKPWTTYEAADISIVDIDAPV